MHPLKCCRIKTKTAYLLYVVEFSQQTISRENRESSKINKPSSRAEFCGWKSFVASARDCQLWNNSWLAVLWWRWRVFSLWLRVISKLVFSDTFSSASNGFIFSDSFSCENNVKTPVKAMFSYCLSWLLKIWPFEVRFRNCRLVINVSFRKRIVNFLQADRKIEFPFISEAYWREDKCDMVHF